jgi:predicted AAA+ superfamily ATPase
LLRIIATGSVAGALRKGSRESGQGRWDELRVGSLTFGEHIRLRAAIRRESAEVTLRRDPNPLDDYLQLGGFPEHLFETNFRRVRARIRSDIADRAIARDLADTGVDVEGVRRLFVYLAAQSGGVFSAGERARDLSVDERTVKSWIDHLLDAQLIARLEQHGRGSKRLRTKPKIYAADHGMVGAFAASPDRRHDPEIFGRIVETAVFRHLRDAFDDPTENVRYFRSANDLEGDFVVGDRREPIVIEVTSSGAIKPEKVRRLREVGEALGTKSLVLVHLGIGKEQRDGVRRVPLEDFLLHPAQIGDSHA